MFTEAFTKAKCGSNSSVYQQMKKQNGVFTNNRILFSITKGGNYSYNICHKRTNIIWFYLKEVFRIVKFM
jgi:hypothetical protein